MTTPMPSRLLRAIIPAAFLLSGMAGLVYEVVWSKYLTLFIGGTALAHTIVLATFMGGLACGNAVFGRVADRPGTNTLRSYALLEVGVGLCCLLFPALLARLGTAYLALGAWTGPTSALNPVLKALFAVASLFVPCTLMGGTLPLLTKAVTESVAGLGIRLGRLYFFNTAGAVFGCLLGGYYLIEAWGLELAMVATSLVNFGIGAVIYLFSRSPRTPPAPSSMEELSPAAGGIAYTLLQSRVAFWCIAVAGVLTMLYEIVWFRLLVLSIGGTVHSFSTMLAGFVVGIAAGAGVAARLSRSPRNALALFGVCELLIGLCTLVPFALFERLPFAFFRIGSRLVHSPDNYGLYTSLVVVFAMMLMGVPALLMGAALPLASRVCVARLEVLGRGVGNVFSVNTVGNVVGALLVGLVVLPAIGLERTLLLGGVTSGTLGVIILWAWRRQGPDRWWRSLRDALAVPAAVGPRLWPGALLLVLGTALWRGLGGPFWDPRMLQSGLYRWERAAQQVPSSWAALQENRKQLESLYSRDGADASLLVEQYPRQPDGRLPRVVRVNGKPDASSGPDMSNQIFVGHLAAFFHPAPREAMVVGLGSGATAAAVLRHQGIQHLDVAEISPEMVEAARYFAAVNDNVLSNPRLSLAVVDAREYLLLTRRRYDLIVSEPTNVWVPGVSTLFTRDFYEVVRSRLKPGGVFTQWLHAYSIDEQIVASTLRSLRDVFPSVSVWSVTDSDLAFLASDHRPRLDAADFTRRFAQVRPTAGLDATDPGLDMLADPLAFLANQVASQEAVALYWPRRMSSPYRDFFPRLEFAAARTQFQGRVYRLLEKLDERRAALGEQSLYVEEYIRQVPLAAGQRDTLADRFLRLDPSIRRLGEALVLAQLTAAEARTGQGRARRIARAPEAAGLWLLARELERQVRVERSVSVCESYLALAGQALAAEASVLSRPTTEAFEQEIDACASAHPKMAAEWWASTVPALTAAWAPERALERFRRLEADGVVSRLTPSAWARLQFEAARALVRLGHRTEAGARLQASLAVEPTPEAARLALGLHELPGDGPTDLATVPATPQARATPGARATDTAP
jgi:spermidine synthase